MNKRFNQPNKIKKNSNEEKFDFYFNNCYIGSSGWSFHF